MSVKNETYATPSQKDCEEKNKQLEQSLDTMMD